MRVFCFQSLRDIILGSSNVNKKESPVRDDITDTKDKSKLAPIVTTPCIVESGKMKSKNAQTIASPIRFARVAAKKQSESESSFVLFHPWRDLPFEFNFSTRFESLTGLYQFRIP